MHFSIRRSPKCYTDKKKKIATRGGGGGGGVKAIMLYLRKVSYKSTKCQTKKIILDVLILTAFIQ